MTIFYQQTGSGPDLLLIHGWGVHSGFWKPVIPILEQYYTVTIIDLPGFGRSLLDNTITYDLKYLAEQILTVAPEKSTILGWSMGGLIATEIALNFPQRVEKLICVASSPKFIRVPGWPGIKLSLFDKLLNAINDASEDTLARFLSLQFRHTTISRRNLKQLRDELYEYGLPNPNALYHGLEIIRNTDLRSTISALACPAMYLLGNNDVLVPAHIAPQLNLLLSAGYAYVLENACHAPFLSETGNFVQVINNFVQI